jgi:two-component system, OmpR family, osmolarity sensor histidine kinase EnvZ
LEALTLPKGASTELATVVHSFNGLVDEVQQADARKLQMLAGLSHDLRTPLTRLRLRLETELESQLTPRSSEALQADLSAMQTIVNQFMAYVHGNSRAGLGAPDEVEPGVRRALVAYGDEVCAFDVRGDASQLKLPDLALSRIVTNLVGNAQSYGRSPIEVALAPAASMPELAAYAPRADEWALAVFDGGEGMTPEQFEHALQPFVRLDESTGGSGHCGLGLAIVHQLAHQLGGQLLRCNPHPSATQRFGIAFVWKAQ